jgi:hypothetical protein
LREVPLAGRHPADLLEVTQRLFRLADQLDAVVQGAIEQIHWTSASWDAANLGPRRWLMEHCRRAAGEASTRVTTAERLLEHPDSQAAHASGRINLTHLGVITRTLTTLPEPDRDTAEQILLRAALHVNPNELARLARQLEATIDPDREDERTARRYASRYLTAATTFAGMVHVQGLLDPETGAALQTALAALTVPDGPDDPRSAGQRRADALGHLAKAVLSSDQLPEINGAKPVLQITVDWETLRNGLGLRPGQGLGRIGPAGQDLPLDVTTIRRLACDANLIPAVLGGPSGILDIGRTSPSWPLAIRRAAALRDQGCTFPGCHAPIAFCELHHIAHWIEHHGPTSLFNATHLCVRHHHIVHKHGWTLTRHPDGTLTFTSPQGHTTTWQPPATLTDFLPAPGSNDPATPGLTPTGCSRAAGTTPENTATTSTRLLGSDHFWSGPDIACRATGRPTATIRIRTRQRGEETAPGETTEWSASGEPAWAGTIARADGRPGAARSGIRNVKVVPTPCRLVTSIEPPARRARSRSRPRPTCRPPRPPPTLVASKPGPSSRTVANT